MLVSARLLQCPVKCEDVCCPRRPWELATTTLLKLNYVKLCRSGWKKLLRDVTMSTPRTHQSVELSQVRNNNMIPSVPPIDNRHYNRRPVVLWTLTAVFFCAGQQRYNYLQGMAGIREKFHVGLFPAQPEGLHEANYLSVCFPCSPHSDRATAFGHIETAERKPTAGTRKASSSGLLIETAPFEISTRKLTGNNKSCSGVISLQITSYCMYVCFYNKNG